jgi:hypothetical protein
MKANLEFFDDFGGSFTCVSLNDKDGKSILNASSRTVKASYNSQTFVLDLFHENGTHLLSMKMSESKNTFILISMVNSLATTISVLDENSINISCDLKSTTLMKSENDEGSPIYLMETLNKEVERMKVEKEKIEKVALLKASLKKDIETSKKKSKASSK